jgi:hypothetical protein
MQIQFAGSASAVRAHEEILGYWRSRRDRGRLPGRAQIDPEHIKRHLPTISLIDVRATDGVALRDYRLRLAGTGLYGVYGGEITGKRLSEVYAADAAIYWRTELDKVVESRSPGVGLHSLEWRGVPHLSILWLRLPLAGDGDRVDMILGYDVVVGAQSDWRRSGIRAA